MVSLYSFYWGLNFLEKPTKQSNTKDDAEDNTEVILLELLIFFNILQNLAKLLTKWINIEVICNLECFNVPYYEDIFLFNN